MCSVLHNPIPAAPKDFPCFASSGVSAFILTSILFTSAAHDINSFSSSEKLFSFKGIFPRNISPVCPLTDMKSPSFSTYSPTVIVLFISSIFISEHPVTQHFPIPLATTAPCEVAPPFSVTIPWARVIP